MSEEKDDRRYQARSQEEIALELMKFIALQTQYGKMSSGAGFAAKTVHTPEQYAEALLELYQRCLKTVSGA